MMRLSFEPETLSEKFDLEFAEGKDDLDYFLASHFFDEIIGSVVLIRYRNAPQSGTPVYVDSQFSCNVAIERIINVLRLEPEHVNWTRELAKSD